MKSWRIAASSLAIAAAALAGPAAAQEGHTSRFELSILGGMQALNENDTALPDVFVNVPVVANLAWHLSPNWALEGDFAWLIPVERGTDVGSGVEQDRKTPDILTYQAGVRASLPLAAWTPYLAAGAGAVTFLENTDPDRLPQLTQSETAFAIHLGAGANYPINAHWGLRGDVRELVAFPSNDAEGLSSGGEADPIWMTRAAV